jgi:hypothetical protein
MFPPLQPRHTGRSFLGTPQSEDLSVTFCAPIKATKNLSRQATSETNSKSEYRNPKQTQKKNQSQIGKIQNTDPKEACLEFYLFWSFGIVSNFGSFDNAQDRFRAPNFLFRAPFDSAQDMLCSSPRGIALRANSSTSIRFVFHRASHLFPDSASQWATANFKYVG